MKKLIYNILPRSIQTLIIHFYKKMRFLLFYIQKSKLKKQYSNIDFKDYYNFTKSRKYGHLKHICYAPYTSMFFSRNGQVSPCYASYNNSSPNIKNNTIKEIFKNANFNEIRKDLAIGDFSKNCNFCKEIFNSKNYESLLLNKYEHFAFSKKATPIIMEFELSNKCNLECIMCDSNLSSKIASNTIVSEEKEKIFGEKFFAELEEFIPNLQLAEFTGGDPFLIEEYYRIWEMISNVNPKCELLITTNANTMNANILHLLKINKNIHFNISIDSINKEVYEKIRVNGKLETALKNFEIFKNYCKKNNTNLNILVCPLTVNYQDLPNLVNFANEHNVGIYFHTVVKPKHLSLKYLTTAKLNEIILFLERHQIQANTYLQKQNKANYLNLINLLKSWLKETVSKEQNTSKQEQFISIDELKDYVSKNMPNELEKLNQVLNSISNNKGLDLFFTSDLLSLPKEKIINAIVENNYDELLNICKNIITNKNATK